MVQGDQSWLRLLGDLAATILTTVIRPLRNCSLSKGSHSLSGNIPSVGDGRDARTNRDENSVVAADEVAVTVE
jgi:hypothetical protein